LKLTTLPRFDAAKQSFRRYRSICGMNVTGAKEHVMEDMGGSFWSLAVIGGPVLLAFGLAYSIFHWSSRSRSPTLKAARDQATREIYHDKKARPT